MQLTQEQIEQAIYAEELEAELSKQEILWRMNMAELIEQNFFSDDDFV